MAIVEQTKKIVENYNAPTPTIWRKIGDSLLVIGTTVTGISAFTMPPVVTAIAAGLTAIGKILTNFFPE